MRSSKDHRIAMLNISGIKLVLALIISIALLATGCSSAASEKKAYKTSIEKAFGSVKDDGQALLELEKRFDEKDLSEEEFENEISKIKAAVDELQKELSDISAPEKLQETHESFLRSADIMEKAVSDLERASNFRSRVKTKAAIIRAELDIARALKIYENAHTELTK